MIKIDFDATGLYERAGYLSASMQRVAKDTMQRAAVGIGGAIQSQMNAGSTSEGEFNNSNKLNSNTGTLARAFVLQDKNNETRITVSGTQATMDYSINVPYAEIHEEGGFIKSKGKMEQFFWANYLKTGIEKYKIMALAVKKNGGINIPKRPFWSKGLKLFETKMWPSLLSRHTSTLLTNAWKES